MYVPSTQIAVSAALASIVVREYTSARVFHQDAQELYTRSGYTVSNTGGLAHRSFLMRVLDFWGLRQEHLVITYQAPTNPWPVHVDTQ